MNALACDERFGLLVDAEWLYRQNRRLERYLGEAKLTLGHACLEDVDYAPRRQLDRALVQSSRSAPLPRQADSQ
jgi:hypothetical protein